ncbi:MAG TPA: hypothetical protein VGG44_10555 [Tepidisphaeraceae bacterium]|jgi:hypothetical protein
MIFFLATREHSYTVTEYLDTWGRENRGIIRPISYGRIFNSRRLRRGTYIFSDLERLSGPQLELAQILHEKLTLGGDGIQLLNTPAKVLRREPLLRELHRLGKNPFAVYRVGENLDAVRFPVFLRRENDHDGSLTNLLNARNELDDAILKAVNSGVPREDLLVVEYCQTVDSAGMFSKYSAFCINGKIIARHVLYGNDWVLKYPSLVTDANVAEEEAYLSANPHELEAGEIFKLAKIDYGRIDYSLLNGKLVTWEINTNPIITVFPERIAPPRMLGQARFAALFNAEMQSIDIDSRGAGISLELPPLLLREAGMRKQDNLRGAAASTVRRINRRLRGMFR